MIYDNFQNLRTGILCFLYSPPKTVGTWIFNFYLNIDFSLTVHLPVEVVPMNVWMNHFPTVLLIRQIKRTTKEFTFAIWMLEIFQETCLHNTLVH